MKPLTTPPTAAPFMDRMGERLRNNDAWTTWIYSLFKRADRALVVPAYAVADLTTANGMAAADWADGTFSGIIYVTDASGGASTAYSDGTNWISHKTGAAV